MSDQPPILVNAEHSPGGSPTKITQPVELPLRGPKFGSRVIVRSDVVFQRDEDRSVKCWGEPHSFTVESDDVAWERVQTVGEDWVALELGWVEEPSLLILRNPPPRWQRNPTPEEKAEADARIVEVAAVRSPVQDVLFWIEPGRQSDLSRPRCRLMVRCCRGQVKLSIVAIPR